MIRQRLLALAGFGVSPHVPPRWGWNQSFGDVAEHGLAGLLAAAHEAGAVELDPSTQTALETRLEGEAIRAVQLEGELIRLASFLAEHPVVVLKGAVLAHGAYADPAQRPFTDLDLLVPGPHLRDAIETLSGFGYERARPEPSPGFDERIGKAVVLRHPSGTVVDLHRTLAAGRHGVGIDVDELVMNRCMVPVGPIEVPAPAWEAHWIETALHAVCGDGLGRALSIRDVAQVAVHPDLRRDEVIRLARRWHVADVVTEALRATSEAFDLDLHPRLSKLIRQGHTVTDAELLPPTRSVLHRIDQLRAAPFRDRIVLARSLVAPRPEFLRWTYGPDAPMAHLYPRRWCDLLRRWRTARGDRPPPRAESPA